MHASDQDHEPTGGSTDGSPSSTATSDRSPRGTGRDRSIDRPHPFGSHLFGSRLFGLGLLGANLFGLLGLVTLLSGALRPPQQTVPTTQTPSSLTTPPAFASSDSNNRMIAVCGVDATGSSILYLVDTESKQLAIYQATGGGRATQNVRLVGARKIDLDLQLVGFHDDSEYSYEDLEKRFERIEQDAIKAAAK